MTVLWSLLTPSVHTRDKARSIWSKRKFLLINNDAASDIRLLKELFQSQHLTSLWERPIGL